MATIVTLGGVTPTIGEDVYLAPTAVLVGDVHVGDRASIWFGAVLRGDSDRITIGARSSIQDNAVVHVAAGVPTTVGEDVIVGHGALIEGCVIGDRAIVGTGAVVLQRARMGARSMLAAGGVLAEGAEIGPEMLAAGVPAKERKRLAGNALRWVDGAADEYQKYRARYLADSSAQTRDLEHPTTS